MMATPLLSIQNISKRFSKPLDIIEKTFARLGADIREEVVHAVDNVSVDIFKGEVVGLVGESGCGKSTLGRVIAGIHQQNDGDVFFKGQNVQTMSKVQYRDFCLQVQMIFQDPMSSLNPRKRVMDIIGEAPLVHGIVSRKELADYVDQIMTRVGLEPAYKQRYPHQFSGGQRQRIGIARALAVKPACIVCDESVAALDVSIQAQVLNLFMELREEFDLTYFFISHDLGIVKHLSDRVIIMYLGRIVESAPADLLFKAPNHPYTEALLKEVPHIDNRNKQFSPITGEIPSPIDPPTGCHFHPRCPKAIDRCKNEQPPLKKIGKNWRSACHLNQE